MLETRPSTPSTPGRPGRSQPSGATSGPGRGRSFSPRSRARLRLLAIAAVGFLVVVLGSAAVLAAAVSTRPVVYTASTQVLYSDATNNILDDARSSGDPDRTLANQAQVVVSDAVTTEAAPTLDMSQTDLVDAIEVTTLPQSDVLVISVTAETADEAVRRAKVLTDRYLEIARNRARASLSSQVQSLEEPIQALRDAVLFSEEAGRLGNAAANQEALSGLLQRQAQLKAAAKSEQGRAELLTAATVPDAPSSLSAKTGAVAGAAVGFVLATGLLLLVVWWRRPPASSDA